MREVRLDGFVILATCKDNMCTYGSSKIGIRLIEAYVVKLAVYFTSERCLV